MSNAMLAEIEQILTAFEPPSLGMRLGDVATVAVGEGPDGPAIEVETGFPLARYGELLERELRSELPVEARAVPISLRCNIKTHAVQRNLKPLGEIRNIIAVASAKGGVGKSTTAVNLALALSREGASVGLLDADIYGPSQPRMLGLRGEQPVSEDGKHLQPLIGHGIRCMSIGFLIDEEQPMVWGGPMVTQALRQLIHDTLWGPLDYLIIDMPPGTGDIQLTLSQQIPVSGAVIVTTPQDIALLDARKGLKMFEKVQVTVLGIVENMSTHVCSNCGHEEAIFGTGGGQAMASDSQVPLLGSLPPDRGIREGADGGTPSVVSDPDGAAAEGYFKVARRAAARLAATGKDYSRAFPKIVVEE